MDAQRRKQIEKIKYEAYQLRRLSVLATSSAGSGHVTSCLSAADIVAVLFFYAIQFDVNDPDTSTNDQFILSKGHAAPLLYAAWKEVGVISEQDLMQLRKFTSVLEGHPTPRFCYTKVATGSLGQGLSMGAGYALAAQLAGSKASTYVLLGDAETNEGSIWEAADFARHYKLHRLIAVVDCNRLGQSEETIEGHLVNRYLLKFGAFGWYVILVDGHSVEELMNAIDQAKTVWEMPVVIIAKTYKGYGVARVENKEGYHGKAFSNTEVPSILTELKERFAPASMLFDDKKSIRKNNGACNRKLRKHSVLLPKTTYSRGEMIATRRAFGQALTVLGSLLEEVMVLDGDVKNSTYTELFEQRFPQRFVQCFIAEQNMVGVGIGLAQSGKVPFVATFGAFLTRAHDQIRMASVSRAPLRLVGSHAGVSIGEDGPSQMALEDIALFRAMPNSMILYPCDAVSTYHCVGLMANYEDGVSYLRLTRGATAVVYDENEQFFVGDLKVLRSSNTDRCCMVAAGITVYEALKAYEILREQHIMCSVVDCYSVKPLPTERLMQQARAASMRMVIAEDHYRAGGLGEAITATLCNKSVIIHHLAVDVMPQSGTPEELRCYVKIDAAAIVDAVKNILSHRN